MTDISASRNPRQVVTALLLEPVRRECVDGLNAIGGYRVVVEKTIDQMREMTRCPEFPEGLDMTTDDHSDRAHLYDMREDMQEEYGLYFTGSVGIGIKFTAHPFIGMGWREQEFNDAARSRAKSVVRMWSHAMNALPASAHATAQQMMRLAVDRERTLDQTHEAMEAALVAMPDILRSAA